MTSETRGAPKKAAAKSAGNRETFPPINVRKIYDKFEFRDDHAFKVFDGTRATTGSDFNPLQVEKLLNEAADLLDRVVANRASFDALRARAYEVFSTKENATLKSLLLQRQRAKRTFEDEYHRASDNLSVSDLRKTRAISKYRWLTRFFNNEFSRTKRQTALNIQKESGQLSGAPYSFFSSDPNDSYNKKRTIIWRKVRGAFAGGLVNIDDYLAAIGVARAKISWKDREHAISLQKQEAEDAKQIADEQNKAAIRLTKWEDLLAGYSDRRAQIDQFGHDLLVLGAAENGAPLNFSPRLRGLQKRVARDFEHALSRMHAAAEGLEEVYGVATVIPKQTDGELGVFFDECLIWVRAHIETVTRLIQSDEVVEVPISLIELANGGFGEARNGQGWVIKDASKQFSHLKHPRMRSISAFLVGWNCEKAFFELSVSVGRSKTVVMPTISAISTAHPLKKYGHNTLRNLSPHGGWKVSLGELTRTRISDKVDWPHHSDIKDIILMVSVAHSTRGWE